MCLLALLQKQPCHAYQLVARLEARGLTGISYGTIYPLMTRLRGLGLLEVKSEPSPSGPARNVFSPSAAGRDALAVWAEQWWSSTSVVHALLTDCDVLPATVKETS